MTLKSIVPLLAAALALLLPSSGEAQFGRGNSTIVRQGSGHPDVPGDFTFCRLQFDSGRSDGSGYGWNIDFPRGDRHILLRLSELTPTTISRWSHGEPGFTVVRATDPELFSCPFLMASDVGELEWSDAEATQMREYLLRGGFFWADDFWGSAAWRYFENEMLKVIPGARFVELTPEHPLFDIVYEIPRFPQVPNLNSWRSLGQATSEMGFDSEHAGLWALYDESGRIMVLASHNTDIQDGWEREADDAAYFARFSPDAYAVGINILVWVMTH